MDTQLTPIIDDGMVIPTNPWQENWKNSLEVPSISTTIEEWELHGSYQEVNRMFSSRKVLIPTSRPHQRIIYLVFSGYTIHEVREEFHA